VVLRTTHVAIVLSLVLRVTAAYRYLSTLHLRPALLLVGSFLTLIAFGTGLLLVPAATADGQAETSVMDALFTAASAVCVTGLTVVDTGVHWSRPGQYVVLGLIQLGGLGLMTYGSVFAMFMWRGLRLRESIVLREVVSHDLVAEIRRVVLFILLATVLAEAAGALLMMNLWTRTCTGDLISMSGRIYYSVFHSVSAFCNAGFSLYPENLMAVGSAWETNLVFPLLIITGGIGFGVLYNLLRLVRYGLFGRQRGTALVKRRLTLQSKLALVVTAGLLAGGTLLAYVFETYPGRTRDWQVTAYLPAEGVAGAATGTAGGGVTPTVGGVTGDQQSPLGGSWADRLVNAWFLATTSRTAGFNTTDTTRLSPPTKFLVVALMFIGASPGSTGGGIKTVTFAVICLGIWSALRGRPYAQAFHRTIPWGIVTRALALLAVSAIWVALVTMIICAWGLGGGARFTFLDVLFETMSAFGTVGLSTGATPLLNTFGRLLVVATMFLGRVGPITLLVTMQSRAEASARYTYPPENVATS
jgi:trk system potassium uptake protein TrkH